MKKAIIGSILVVGLATGLAYAHGNGNWGGGHMYGSGHHYGMMGPGMMGRGGARFDCPGANWSGRYGGDSGFNQKYMDETAELRKQMHDLRFDYMEAYRNPNTTREDLVNLEEKMEALQGQLYEKSRQLQNGN